MSSELKEQLDALHSIYDTCFADLEKKKNDDIRVLHDQIELIQKKINKVIAEYELEVAEAKEDRDRYVRETVAMYAPKKKKRTMKEIMEQNTKKWIEKEKKRKGMIPDSESESDTDFE